VAGTKERSVAKSVAKKSIMWRKSEKFWRKIKFMRQTRAIAVGFYEKVKGGQLRRFGIHDGHLRWPAASHMD
jgi:hypothetical protein